MDIKNQFKIYKNYLYFAASTLLISIIIIYTIFLYFNFKKDLNEIEKSDGLEVSLPVIDWQKYSGLSKQYADDKINKRNN